MQFAGVTDSVAVRQHELCAPAWMPRCMFRRSAIQRHSGGKGGCIHKRNGLLPARRDSQSFPDVWLPMTGEHRSEMSWLLPKSTINCGELFGRWPLDDRRSRCGLQWIVGEEHRTRLEERKIISA